MLLPFARMCVRLSYRSWDQSLASESRISAFLSRFHHLSRLPPSPDTPNHQPVPQRSSRFPSPYLRLRILSDWLCLEPPRWCTARCSSFSSSLLSSSSLLLPLFFLLSSARILTSLSFCSCGVLQQIFVALFISAGAESSFGFDV